MSVTGKTRTVPCRYVDQEGRLTTRWSRPGQPEVEFGAILALAGRAAHLEAVRRTHTTGISHGRAQDYRSLGSPYLINRWRTGPLSVAPYAFRDPLPVAQASHRVCLV